MKYIEVDFGIQYIYLSYNYLINTIIIPLNENLGYTLGSRLNGYDKNYQK
jgi:hypothetical protein